MEIYFDRRTARVLRYINHTGEAGAKWGVLRDKFGDDASPSALEALSEAGYTVTKNEKGEWINMKRWDRNCNHEFRSCCSPKGRKILEDRFDRLWQWCIPVLISVAALIISFFALFFPPSP